MELDRWMWYRSFLFGCGYTAYTYAGPWQLVRFGTEHLKGKIGRYSNRMRAMHRVSRPHHSGCSRYFCCDLSISCRLLDREICRCSLSVVFSLPVFSAKKRWFQSWSQRFIEPQGFIPKRRCDESIKPEGLIVLPCLSSAIYTPRHLQRDNANARLRHVIFNSSVCDLCNDQPVCGKSRRPAAQKSASRQKSSFAGRVFIRFDRT